MYVYIEPRGGLNDCMVTIQNAIEYCKIYDRILLINGLKSEYEIIFSDYFNFPYDNIICDITEIITICSNINHTIYPDVLNGKMLDILNNKCNFSYLKPGMYLYNGVILNLPNIKRDEDIIIFVKCGGGDGYTLFKELLFSSNVKNVCNQRYNLLKKPYLCIQIRNTDLTCDYELLYNTHENVIRTFNEIYIATDDRKVLDFYKSKGLTIQNFTTFPNNNYRNLHTSSIPPDTRIIDLLCDIYIISMSDLLISNSKGGFIKLVTSCNKNKQQTLEQFL